MSDSAESTPTFEEANSVLGVIGELAGYASLCWTTRVVEEGKYGQPDTVEKVFDSDRAARAVNAADERIKQIHRADLERTFQGDPPVLGDYHDEDTLFKFHRALAKCNIDDVEMVTHQVLNDGLLIRERR